MAQFRNICPRCRSRKLKLLKSYEHPLDHLGDWEFYKCKRCKFRFTVEGDGVIPLIRKVIRRRRIVRRRIRRRA